DLVVAGDLRLERVDERERVDALRRVRAPLADRPPCARLDVIEARARRRGQRLRVARLRRELPMLLVAAAADEAGTHRARGLCERRPGAPAAAVLDGREAVRAGAVVAENLPDETVDDLARHGDRAVAVRG